MATYNVSPKLEPDTDGGIRQERLLNPSTNINLDSSSNLKTISSTRNHNAGFSPNAFGGFNRLDNVDLRPLRSAIASPESVLYLHVIMDAAHNYLFYGLCNNNGTTLEEFFYSYEYFFKVKSGDLERYSECKNVTKEYYEDGHHIVDNVELTLKEYDLMCFDMHIKLSGMKCSAEQFTTKLKNTRKAILKQNWQQVNKHFNDLNADGDQYRLVFVDRYKILLEPQSPEELESLLH
jgi:hypothetical protein